MKILPRTPFVFAAMFALLLVVPLARVEAGGRKTTPRKPFEPVYNAITSVDATAHTLSYSTVNGKGTPVSKTSNSPTKPRSR